MEQSFSQVSQTPVPAYATAPQCPVQQGPAYNAVKIDIINPQVNTGNPGPSSLPYNVPVASAYPQYAPIYNYPQNNVAPYPYVPPAAQQVCAQPPAAPKEVPAAPAAAPVAPPPSEVDSQPAPEAAKVAAQTPTPDQSQGVDGHALTTALQSKNPDEQAAAIQKIAEVALNNKEQALTLMAASNGELYKGLTDIVSKDTTKLKGQDKEKAELNKDIGMWTMAILLKNFRETLDVDAQKQNVPPVSIAELGGLIMPIVKNIQSDPNPEIRKGGIFALSYVAKPQDYETLSTAFNLVIKQDKDKGVKEAAKKALSELPKPEKQAPTAKAADVKKTA